VRVPDTCPLTTAQACGCDDFTYENSCLLQQALAAKAYDGECVVQNSRLREGQWGGTGIRMMVTANGAILSFGCVTGTVDVPPVVPGYEGSWGLGHRMTVWSGTYDGASVTYRADFSPGSPRLSLSAQLPDGGTLPTPAWQLTFGDPGAIGCP